MSIKHLKLFLICLAVVFLVSACTQVQTIDHIPKEENVVGIDFTRYSEKGFLFTPGEFGGNYTTIGLLTFSIYPEGRKIPIESQSNQTQGASPAASNTQSEQRFAWEIDSIDLYEVIDLAYKEAVKRGADAITHLEIRFKTKSHRDGFDNVDVTGVEVTGLLISRDL